MEEMARNDKDFLGLEVLNLEDASVAGEVDGLIVDETRNAVVGLVVDLSLYEAKALPFADLRAIGDDAVTIASIACLRPLSAHEELLAVAERGIGVSDTPALTDRGRLVGVTGDYYVDQATGSITGLEIFFEEEGEDERRLLVPAREIVRIGAELVIIREGFAERAVAGPDELPGPGLA